MQSKTPLLMVTALVCGLGAAFGTWKLVSNAKDGPVDDQKVQVLVPVNDVAPYHMFQDDKRFTMMEWPKSKLREGEEETIKSFDQIKGKTSRHYKLKPNEPIYKNDICDSMDNDIQDRLRNGEVAHAIPVTADQAAGGFVKVGDLVDISATVQPGGGETAPRTFYFLEAIEVLAVDNSSKQEVNQMTTPPTRFLLRLTRPQSLVIKFYQDSARISIDKRKKDDLTKVGDSFYYTASKKPSSAGSYAEDTPEPTVTQNIETKTLSDPTVDETVKQRPVNNNTTNPGPDLTEEEKRRRKNEVTINDNGTPRKQQTNAEYVETLIKNKAAGNKEEPKKEKDEEGKKAPGQ